MKKFLLACLFFAGIFWALSTYQGLAVEGQYDSMVLNFRDSLSPAQVDRELKAIASKYGLAAKFNSAFSKTDKLYVVKGDAQVLEKLKQSEELRNLTEYVEANYVYSMDFIGGTTPNDPMYGQQWNLRAIDVEKAWQKTKGKGITIAVIDTGVSRVEDLKNTKFVKGYDFVNDREDASDDNGHGTHVAGTIAQSTNNNFGVAGIAYEASIMPLKVLSASGGGTISDIAEAIIFAADNGANVINMSLGGGGESKLMQEAIDYAYKKGVVVVAAAGNSNRNAAFYPARYPKVIAVSATSATGEKAPYSNYGAGVDVAAPGGAIARAKNGEKGDISGGILQNTIDPKTKESVFRSFQGTSMAAPHVAGVVALIEASGVKDPEKVMQIVKQSARKVADDTQNYYGAGHLNAATAVTLASEGQLGVPDFLRWARDNGYLSPRFWIDGGAVALIPKLIMVIGSYLLAWLLNSWFPFRWNWSFSNGVFFGGAGLFFLRGFYVFDLTQVPFRIAGSSLAELGNAFSNTNALNPITASVLLPLGLLIILLGHPQWKWFAIGSAIGTTACLATSAVLAPQLMWIGEGMPAIAFLSINAILCFGCAYLSIKSETATI
ncbi:peptidase S8 [Pseudanabaena sp. FACHB-1998]|uniref:S8 family peptidase n=1 Tax=Pseudanabaena sp. FACHB-1998 TaxID=2692858 RepID=UPI0016800FAB|nr:S8 family peptidase [Pseudanabaena sp. FACHB-1998]MBD2178225.1 peptidase S8 [Pseudanabaena sp. FACHB-1998]